MNRSFLVLTPSRLTGGVSAMLPFAIVVSLALLAAFLCTTPAHAAPITIDMVTVGNPENDPDTTGYGAVNYEYRIGKYDVTIGQYTEFLNAVAKTDTYSLYNTTMGTNLNVAGIARTGSSGSYIYSVINNGGDSSNRPITYVSWFDAARFANWMQNGQGSSSTETGAYTLNGATSGDAPAKNPGAQFYIPTDNEWYKAAYYSPVKGGVGSPGYYAYATQSDSAPGNTIGPGTNQANYYNGVYSVTQSASYSSSQNYLTDVGAFTNSASFYGTLDQSGNVYQWNDLDGLAASGSFRGLRGGWNGNGAFFLSSSSRLTRAPSLEIFNFGFRLASPVAVPEPSTWVMGLAGIACAGWGAWRRRQQRRAGVAPFVVVLLALPAGCLWTTPAHATNLLVNPGAETGELTPWSITSAMGAAVTSGISTGSTTVGTATLQATEGSRWFSGDGTLSDVGAVWSGYLRTMQRVDVRGLSVDSVRFGGDGFAAGQILAGTSNALEVWHRHLLIFRDANLGYLGIDDVSAQGGPQIWQSVANQAASSLGVSKTSTVPINTAFIDFQQQYDLKAYSGSGMTYRVVVGLDHAFLEIATVPEPSTSAMALAGIACGGYSMWRRRQA